MASVVIQFDGGSTQSGRTIYGVIKNATGQYRITSSGSFEAYNASNWSTYVLTLTEQGLTGNFVSSAITLTDGQDYSVSFRYKATGSFLVADIRVGVGGVGLDSLATANAADKLLGRNLAGGSDGTRTVQDSLRAGRNKVAFDVPAIGSFTVYKEDDSTVAWTGTYTRGTGGPLTATDPS